MATGDAPYRSANAKHAIEMPTRRGKARLELAPQYAQLDIEGKLVCTFTAEFVTLQTPGRKSKRSFRRQNANVAVALSFPGHEVAIWLETEKGTATRLCGTEPPALLDDDAMRAWRQADHLAGRLCEAVAPEGTTARLAAELGKEQDRVLLIDRGDQIDVFARPMFREDARKVFELGRDGTVAAGGAGRRAGGGRPYSVAVSGDYVCVLSGDGMESGRVKLPWLEREDRLEIARRFEALLDAG